MSHDPFPREPLTPEERALARRLGQLGPHGEPSPALDARVLAAARGAPSPARRRRWPAALGVAASLVLAAGIAWRLRPLPEPPPVARPAATTAPAAAAAQPPAGTGMPAPSVAGPPTTSARKAMAARGDAAAAASEEAGPRPSARPGFTPAPEAPMPVPPPPPPEPPVVLDAPAPMAAESALPAPPVAPAPAARAAAPAAVNSAAPAPPARKAAPPAARTAESDTGFDAAAAADAAAGDEPPEDVPPATADAPAVREAWLQRIRELLASGQTDAARASLKEFVRRHPDAPLPDDLRALAR